MAITAASIRRPSASCYVAVVPGRFAVGRRPRSVYVRRRVAVVLVLAAVVVSVAWGAGHVLASRGGAPASAPTARPAQVAGLAATTVYVVKPGDTLWSLARRHHGAQSTEHYLERLIELNGGTSLHVGQAIVLP